MKDESLFAIERVDSHIFALCALATWVTLRLLRCQSAPTSLHAKVFDHKHNMGHAQALGQPMQDAWWQKASIQAISNEFLEKHARSRAKATESSKLPSESLVTANQVASLGSDEHLVLDSLIPTKQCFDPPQGPEAALSTISSQYKEALYASKVNLECSMLPQSPF